jgi:long-chain acyl-CoA synthetase
VANPDSLRAAILQRGIPVRSREEALAHPQVHALYRAAIDQQLADVSHCEQVGRFTLLDRGFTVENGELTPTLKLRRQVIAANFKGVIEAMYEASPSSLAPVAVG